MDSNAPERLGNFPSFRNSKSINPYFFRIFVVSTFSNCPKILGFIFSRFLPMMSLFKPPVAFSSDELILKNPFVHHLKIPLIYKLQMIFFAFTVLPLRFIGLAISFLLTFICGELATRFVDTEKPMSGFRRVVLLPLFKLFARIVFFCVGFHWVTTKGKRASPNEAPIVVLAPHSSYFDSLVVVFLGLPSVVGKTETANSPIGCLIKMTQPILVNRDDPSSRQKTLQEIRRRAKSDGEWPQVVIFPEGTCTNRSCIINYKQGAFSSGVPVQPVVLRWGNSLDTITWTWEGPGIFQILLLTMLQVHNPLELEFLPVYYPSEDEQLDPQLFGQNVRALMADALQLPTSDLSFDDCRRIRTATQFGLPMDSLILEYGKLTRILFAEDPAVDEDASMCAAAQVSRRTRIAQRLMILAKEIRALSEEPTPKVIEALLFQNEPPSKSQWKVISRLINSLPKTNKGHPDLRVIVIHLAMLMFHESPLDAIRISALVFDGCIGSLDPVVIGETGDNEIPSATPISITDAEFLVSIAYRLNSKDFKRLLQKHKSALVCPSFQTQYAVDSADEIDCLLSESASVNGHTPWCILPDTLFTALNADHSEACFSFAKYRAEMSRIHRRLERPFSETASASASLSSLYSINETAQVTSTTIGNGDIKVSELLPNSHSLDDGVKANFAIGHQRSASNASNASELELHDGGLRLRVNSHAVQA